MRLQAEEGKPHHYDLWRCHWWCDRYRAGLQGDHQAQDILTEHNAQVESIHTTKQQIESGEIQLIEGETYTENDYKSDITTTYVKTGLKLAKVYAPAVTLGAVSLGCMFGSHHIMSKRNASLTAAYIALDKAFEEYKSRVSDRFGSRVQEELEHNIKAVELESKSTNEQGVEETIKEYKDIAMQHTSPIPASLTRLWTPGSPTIC